MTTSTDAVPMQFLDIVFDGPPSHESGRFVEVENLLGESVNAGEWIDRGNGLWALRIGLHAPTSEVQADHIADERKMVAVPEGYALVPVKPNDSMQAAGAQAVRMDTTVLNRMWTANRVFAAMVEAASSTGNQEVGS